MQYRVALMPKYRNRPGYPLKPTSITVHNTANPNATAADHVTFLNAQPRSASWHICVDDTEAVLQIPLNEQAWHTGTNAGNTSSVGIEVCEFTDPVRQAAAEANAQALIGAMLDGSAPAGFVCGVGIENVRTHQSWSGKVCPRVILPHWAAFIAGIGTTEGDGGMIVLVTPPEGWARFWRLRAPNGDYLFTASPEEVKSAVEKHGYTHEGAAFDIALGGTQNLHRMAKDGFHHYCGDAEASALVGRGWRNEGIVAKVGSTGAAVFRLNKGAAHLFTTSPTEVASAKAAGWTDEGVAFYTGTVQASADPQVAVLQAKIAAAKAALA